MFFIAFAHILQSKSILINKQNETKNTYFIIPLASGSLYDY